MQKGFFITFEGLDGSGKTTQIQRLESWLRALGEQPLITRQPGGTRIGDRIRTLLLDSRTERLSPMAELGLMFSDRAQAIAEVIGPGLQAGKIVICDRFTDSTEAYQGGGRQLGSEVVLRVHETMCGGLQPDLTVLLMPDFGDSLQRARGRNKRKAKKGPDENRFESEDELFYRRVFDKYREIASREPLRVMIIDSDEDIEEIHQRVIRVVGERLHMPASRT